MTAQTTVYDEKNNSYFVAYLCVYACEIKKTHKRNIQHFQS